MYILETSLSGRLDITVLSLLIVRFSTYTYMNIINTSIEIRPDHQAKLNNLINIICVY